MAKITCVVNDQAKTGSDLKEEHGLSFWIDTQDQVVVFDTGQTSSVFGHNLKVLGLDPHHIDALALSHGHYDHTGGLDIILSIDKTIPLYAHPDLFRPRYALRHGETKEIGLKIPRSVLAEHFDLRLSEAPLEIVPNLWTTGEISERPERIGGSENLLIETEAGWQPDPYKDDMSLVFKTRAGLLLICGCCHAGLINTLSHVERTFNQPVLAVIGGTHLVSFDNRSLDRVIDIINERFQNLTFHLNHCTGNRSVKRLKDAFGRRVKVCPAGTILSWED